jgi:hypothetical protein
MSFGIYLAGYIILIAGLSYGANLLHVPLQVDWCWRCLFRPWRDDDPTIASTVIGLAFSSGFATNSGM